MDMIIKSRMKEKIIKLTDANLINANLISSSSFEESCLERRYLIIEKNLCLQIITNCGALMKLSKHQMEWLLLKGRSKNGKKQGGECTRDFCHKGLF
jgi:hypothetical protein